MTNVIVINFNIWAIASNVIFWNIFWEKNTSYWNKTLSKWWRFCDAVLRILFINHLKIVIILYFLEFLHAAFYHMFAISRGVKLNNFETCLLPVAFTISKVHEFIIQPSYICILGIYSNLSTEWYIYVCLFVCVNVYKLIK